LGIWTISTLESHLFIDHGARYLYHPPSSHVHTERWRGGEAYVSHDSQDLVRLGLLYETPQDHDRHDATSIDDEEFGEVPAPTFRTRSLSSSGKRTRSPSAPEVHGNFSSEEEWDIMSSTGSETNQSEAWEIVGDDM
jgi:hypothetical protein